MTKPGTLHIAELSQEYVDSVVRELWQEFDGLRVFENQEHVGEEAATAYVQRRYFFEQNRVNYSHAGGLLGVLVLHSRFVNRCLELVGDEQEIVEATNAFVGDFCKLTYFDHTSRIANTYLVADYNKLFLELVGDEKADLNESMLPIEPDDLTQEARREIIKNNRRGIDLKRTFYSDFVQNIDIRVKQLPGQPRMPQLYSPSPKGFVRY